MPKKIKRGPDVPGLGKDYRRKPVKSKKRKPRKSKRICV